MTSARLTDHQLAFFETFGFLSFPGLLADRIERITEEFEAIWATHGGRHNGHAHDSIARSCSVQFEVSWSWRRATTRAAGWDIPALRAARAGVSPTATRAGYLQALQGDLG